MEASDKAQEMFIAHCKEWLGGYDYHRGKANEEYQKSYDDEPLLYKKQNAGLRAGNLYLLGELKKIGAESWRLEKGDKKAKIPPANRATGAKVSSGVTNTKPLPKGMKGIQLDW